MEFSSSGKNVTHYRSGGVGFIRFLITPFYNAWQYRELIRVIVGRELIQRFRDSYFGWIWAAAMPLAMLLVYVVMFSHTLKIETNTNFNFALSMYVGLIFFNMFAELATRAPLLLSEHANFIKKSIFPSEVLAWTSMLRTMVYAGISFVVFLGFEFFMMGYVPLAVLLFPFIVLPFCLFLLGTVWFLSAIGAFTRDISFMMATIVPVLMFASPVFYTTLSFPLSSRLLVYIVPIAPYIEMAREILLLGRAPDLLSYGIAWGTALVIFYGGYAFFTRFRSVVVDVI